MIQQRYENGNKLKYQVNYVEENGHETFLEPIEITKTYAKFEGLSFNKYRFKIVSENEVGISKHYTEIIVPDRDEGEYIKMIDNKRRVPKCLNIYHCKQLI